MAATEAMFIAICEDFVETDAALFLQAISNVLRTGIRDETLDRLAVTTAIKPILDNIELWNEKENEND